MFPSEGFGPDEFPENVNPLTGLYVSDPDILNRRPVAIKVNIIPRYNRPPWGLSFADIVYDYYQNNGYTRFHAIYYGNDAEMVGPIRSARFPDDHLIRMYKSIFAYGSADPRINYRLFSADYYDRLVLEKGQTTLCPPIPSIPLCRYDPNGYNFLLAGTTEVHAFIREKGIDDSSPDLNGMFFQTTPPEEGKPGEQVTTHYSLDTYNRWEYDPDTGRYLRYQDNLFLNQGQEEEFVPLVDRLTDQQIFATNVVILFVPHEYYQKPPSEIIEIPLVGNGLAYAFRDGSMYEVSWNRPHLDSLLFLTFPDGSPYPLQHGNTWFQIIGYYSIISQPDENSWRFEFRIP